MLVATGCSTSMHGIVRLLSAELSTFEIVFFRHFLGLLILLPWVRLRAMTSAIRSERLSLHALRGLLGFIGIATWFYGLSVVPLAEATALNFLATVFTSAFAVLFLGETMSARRWMALTLGFAGAFAVLRPGVEAVSLGAAIIILSSALWAVTLIILKRLSATDGSITIVFVLYFFLSLFSLVPALLHWHGPSFAALGWLSLMALVGVIGHLSMTKAFQLADASALMPIDFTRLVWASAIGYIAFAEIPDRWTWGGGALIFAAGLLAARRR